jgi:hypothetical protein
MAHAVRAEDGTKDGLIPGDQDRREVRIQTYYARNDAGKPWEQVLRARDPALAERIALNMTTLAENDRIGYSQRRRMTWYNSAKSQGGSITKAEGDCDCSSGVSGGTQLAGGRVKANLATSNMLQGFGSSGQFDILTDAKYLASADFLRRGDILLRKGHTAVIIDNGSKAARQEDSDDNALPEGNTFRLLVDDYYEINGEKFGVKEWCRVRKGPSIEDDILGKAYRGEIFEAYGFAEDWYQINYHGRVGYIYKTFVSEGEV